jgi:hypothetical protein
MADQKPFLNLQHFRDSIANNGVITIIKKERPCQKLA